MSTLNIFTSYKQRENHFTNGLLALLSLSKHDDPYFVRTFLKDLLSVEPREGIESFRVLEGITGTADAELSGGDCCIRFETKIKSGTLRDDQLRSHLINLISCAKNIKRLVLLTPDDGGSRYIDRFLSTDRTLVQHLAWIRVYNYLNEWISNRCERLFSQLVRQFLDTIQEEVFEQDIAGIVLTVDFSDKSGVDSEKYLDEMKQGKWTRWNTPRQYKQLDGTGRKLMLYDKKQKGITVEAEIEKVEETNLEPDYPWTNFFVPNKIITFDKPIALCHIMSVPGLERFGTSRAPYRNITQEQYRKLISVRSQPLDQVKKVERTSWACKAGCYHKSEFRMAPDFDAPLEEFKEYME